MDPLEAPLLQRILIGPPAPGQGRAVSASTLDLGAPWAPWCWTERAPMSTKRLKHSVPVFIGGVVWKWCRSRPDKEVETEIAEWCVFCVARADTTCA